MHSLAKPMQPASAGVWRSLESAVHTLHLYGAAGIAAFGWAVCRLLGCDSRPWLPLWLCAGLFIYNLDRLRSDPADALNTPSRVEAARRLRGWSMALLITAGAVLVALPLASRDWLTLGLAAGGTLVCVHYSIPFRGRRWKDVPIGKTFFAPAVVTAAIFGLPLLHEPGKFSLAYTPLVVGWSAARLLANMILCDARDLAGDRAGGVVSLPQWAGPHGTERLLWALMGTSALLAAVLAVAGPEPRRLQWLALLPAGALYLSGLIVAVRRPRSERFYERWVEGLLFLPAAVLLALDLFAG
jgi:4-hydroxybenzoate polyprenyltransferase